MILMNCNYQKKSNICKFEVFHLDISGNEINKSHCLNIPAIPLTFEVSHFDISGIEISDLHIVLICSILLI